MGWPPLKRPGGGGGGGGRVRGRGWVWPPHLVRRVVSSLARGGRDADWTPDRISNSVHGAYGV